MRVSAVAAVVVVVGASCALTLTSGAGGAAAQTNCNPSYPSVCLQDGIGDYDCEGGSGNGPNYVQGPITVRQPDPFDLDRDGNGVGCQ